jgi:outer membrane protein insertion porin family
MSPADPSARGGSRWLAVLLLVFACAFLAHGQGSSLKVAAIKIKHVGPATVSDDLIRANIRMRVGEPYIRLSVDDDIKNLYATGLFRNIQVAEQDAPEGVTLTYVVQANPRLVEIKFKGNQKYSNEKLLKKISAKVGDPLDERKLFTDCQTIQKMYEKSGYPGSEVKYVINIEESVGRGTATFEIKETEKVLIERVDFVDAHAFSQKELRKTINTRKHWMFSWLTGHGVYKVDQFDEDREKLAEFYRSHGYIDFEIKDVVLERPTPKKMIVKIYVYEGTPYKVGSVTFKGTTMFPTNDLSQLKLKPGATFTPNALSKDTEKIEDFYGAKGHIDVATTSGNLRVAKIPNTDQGTMDVQYTVEEGQKSYIEKIEIRGNTKTKDRVIRRELAVAPGEVFDMVRVKVSRQRLEGLQYFEKVDVRPEATDIPNRKNLVIGVEEKNTGNVSLGAGFSSVDALVGYVEFTQGNFDLANPPLFTGAGQKFRARVQIGTKRDDYLLSFVEPWFLGRKLAFGLDLYRRQLSYVSLNSLYNEDRTGGRVSLTRALGSDFLIGSVSYTLEDVDIVDVSTNAPEAITSHQGNTLLSEFGASLAFDTRNSVTLPNKGQRTELSGEYVGGPLGGDAEFYKVELKTGWYFKGFFTGHILEAVGRAGVAQGTGGADAPFFERFYLGGLYSMRAYDYRAIGPRELLTDGSGRSEPIGGDTYWFGSLEYSLPVIERLRFAMFYDIGCVQSNPYDFTTAGYADNWGVGLRINLPIGPLRLDYAFPITHPDFVSSHGHFQFGVGYTREF